MGRARGDFARMIFRHALRCSPPQGLPQPSAQYAYRHYPAISRHHPPRRKARAYFMVSRLTRRFPRRRDDRPMISAMAGARRFRFGLTRLTARRFDFLLRGDILLSGLKRRLISFKYGAALISFADAIYSFDFILSGRCRKHIPPALRRL